jgi:hypothetical protein
MTEDAAGDSLVEDGAGGALVFGAPADTESGTAMTVVLVEAGRT